MPKHVGLENFERINKTSTTSLSICWYFCKRYYKILGSTIKLILSINLAKLHYSLIGDTAVIFCTYSKVLTDIRNWRKVKLSIKHEDFHKREAKIKFSLNVLSPVCQNPVDRVIELSYRYITFHFITSRALGAVMVSDFGQTLRESGPCLG
jgi:hypothetical protein